MCSLIRGIFGILFCFSLFSLVACGGDVGDLDQPSMAAGATDTSTSGLPNYKQPNCDLAAVPYGPIRYLQLYGPYSQCATGSCPYQVECQEEDAFSPVRPIGHFLLGPTNGFIWKMREISLQPVTPGLKLGLRVVELDGEGTEVIWRFLDSHGDEIQDASYTLALGEVRIVTAPADAMYFSVTIVGSFFDADYGTVFMTKEQ